MGRRKQANPTRLSDEDANEASTSSDPTNQQNNHKENGDGIKHGKSTDKKSSINFSISAHLQPENNGNGKQNSTKNHKSSNKQNGTNDNMSYLAAQKAYQTLMNNLKQQEALMKSMGFANNNAAAAFFMNPFFGAGTGMSPFDFFASANGLQSSAPKKRTKLEDDSAVDLSTKKKRSNEQKSTTKSTNQNDTPTNSALDKLSSLVTTVGNTPSHINSIMRAQNSMFNQLNADSDPTRVFTCLQCRDRFKSMQELVDHMEKTLHFNQLKSFKNSSSSANPTRHKSMTNSPANSPSPNDKTRANSRGGTFSFECLLCGHHSSGSIDSHMESVHSFKSPNDWISAVKLIPL